MLSTGDRVSRVLTYAIHQFTTKQRKLCKNEKEVFVKDCRKKKIGVIAFF